MKTGFQLSNHLFMFGQWRWGTWGVKIHVPFVKSPVRFAACNEFHTWSCNSESVKSTFIQPSLTPCGMRHAYNSTAAMMKRKRWRTKRPLPAVKHFSCKINENQENLTELTWIAARIRASTSRFWVTCVTNVEAPEIH
jgi:hypothetical protein